MNPGSAEHMTATHRRPNRPVAHVSVSAQPLRMGGSADTELVALWVLQSVRHGPTVAVRRNHDGAKCEQPVPLAVRLLRTD